MEVKNQTLQALLGQVTGRTVLISGGTTGIGRSTAHLLASIGNKVLICGTEREHLDSALSDFAEMGDKENLSGIIADISTKAGVSKLFKEADKTLGEIDILINNAALAFQDIQEGQFSDWQYVVNTNLLSYLACSNEAISRMMRRKSGHIVNIGSISADVREEGSSVYVATKSAIQGFSEALRKEVNPLGIKVSLIEPGATGTDMQPMSPATQRKKEQKLEMLTAEDIANAVLYVLCQPERCDVVSMQIRPHLQLI